MNVENQNNTIINQQKQKKSNKKKIILRLVNSDDPCAKMFANTIQQTTFLQISQTRK